MSVAPLRIAFITSEMTPFHEDGRLADVSAALPRALARLGHQVTVFLPRYGRIAFPPGEFAGSVHVPVDASPRSAGYYRRAGGRAGGGVHRASAVLRPPASLRAQRARGLRGQPAALRVPRPCRPRVPAQPRTAADVFPRARLAGRPGSRLPEVVLLGRSRALSLAVRVHDHNLAYQGTFGGDTLDVLGLPGTSRAARGHGAPGRDQLHQGRHPVLGDGHHRLAAVRAGDPGRRDGGTASTAPMRARSADLVGILNGVDYAEWDPSHDQRIAATYSWTTSRARRSASAISSRR